MQFSTLSHHYDESISVFTIKEEKKWEKQK